MFDLHNINIVPAHINDAETLTQIAFTAKRYWNYPDHYYELWKDELTVSTDYILKNTVFKAIIDNDIIGFYSIVEVKEDFYAGEVFVQEGFWLEHVFILPDYHKQGIGRLMIEHAKKISSSNGIQSLQIFVDPYAQGFYEKIGAIFQTNSKSSIENRMIPVYLIKTNN